MPKNLNMSIDERFKEKYVVNFETGCWEWIASSHYKGYGRFWPPGESKSGVMAHRWAYERWIGPIAAGLQIDHLCGNTSCVNPHHLEPVTGHENILRGTTSAAAINARKTHCPRGHEFTLENTKFRKNNNARICIVCAREYAREWQQRRRYEQRRAMG